MGPEQNYGYPAPQPNYGQPQPQDQTARIKRLVILVGGVLGALTIIIIILSIVFSPPSIRPDLAKIAAQQNEIARVAQLGLDSDDARRATQNLAATVHTASLTNVTTLRDWARQNLSSPLSRASLASEQNDNTDTTLTAAGDTNNYDQVFEDAMRSLLSGANQQIISSFDTFSDQPDLQEILNDIGESNQIVLDSITSE